MTGFLVVVVVVIVVAYGVLVWHVIRHRHDPVPRRYGDDADLDVIRSEGSTMRVLNDEETP